MNHKLANNKTENTLNKLKEQAEINAMKRIQTLFNTSDQLEQIEQHIIRNEKRKNMIESQLKSAIQSHFISVNSCMEQLKDVNNSLNGVKNTIYGIEQECRKIGELEKPLSELRKEAAKHKQLKSAKENVRNILNVDDLAKQANKYIEENKILLAHKCILDIEKCRNDILEELGPPNDKIGNIDEIKLVEEFFKKLKEIQKTIQNHIFLIIKRMLEVSKSFPEQLVTALRIIEREEVLDEYWLKKEEETGFKPKDRPRRWRSECQKTIKKMIETKILGCRIEERETDESWFSKHLGNICTRSVQDLEIVKKLCEPCFPPSYKIFDFFVATIHEVLSEYIIKDLLDKNQLKGQEFFVLLSWQDTYKSNYFMGHPSLQIDTSKLPDILDETSYKRVLDAYLDHTMVKVESWFKNALEKNFNEWLSNVEPYLIEGCYESNMPNDINSMLIQQLDLMNYANDDRFSKEILKFLTNQLSNFIDLLKGKVIDLRISHIRNAQLLKNNYFIRMVITSNDCMRLSDCFLNIRDKYDKFMDRDEVGGPNDNYVLLGEKILNVSDFCLDLIIEDMTKCLDDQFFKILLSREWLTNEKVIITIVETSRDYMNDLVHLKPQGRMTVLIKWHNRIKVEYMKGFLQNLSIITRVLKKCQFNEPNERILFSTKLTKEIITLQEWFKNMASSIGDKNSFDFDILILMNKIIKADDVDFIGVEIGALVKKCPDLTSDMLFALLSLRGDISKAEYKEKYEDYILSTPEIQTKDKSKSPSSKQQNQPKTDEAMIILKRELKIQQ